MRIGIDARLFYKNLLTGIPRSVYEVIKVWAEEYPQHEYFLFSSRPIQLDLRLPDNWHIVDDPWIIDKSKLWSIFKLPELLKNTKLDVFWGTNYILPQKIDGPKYYVTIYDLSLFKFKKIGTLSNTIRLKLFTKSACKRAHKIIAISKATANDIISEFGISPEKICVSYCGGMPSNYKSHSINIEKVNPQLIFPEKFILFISTIEPRKNVPTIIKAFEKYINDTNSNLKLVIAGGLGWKYQDTLRTIKECKYRDRIIMPGFISDIEKSYLLANASAFVYPSLYEGFGIPILEAMEYSLPVITTNISSMPEVGGDAVFYIDQPFDYISLAKKLDEVLTMQDEKKEIFVNRMRNQLLKFSWEKNAKEIMNIFEQDYIRGC